MLREKYQHDLFITNRHITVQGHYPKKDTSKYLDATDGFRSAVFCHLYNEIPVYFLIAQNLVYKLLRD